MKAKAIIAIGAAMTGTYVLALPLSYLGLRLADLLLGITYSPDEFFTVLIVTFGLSGVAVAVSLPLNLVLLRLRRLNAKHKAIASVAVFAACSIFAFLVYVQCGTAGIEYLLSSSASVATENALRAVITSIIPSQGAFWATEVLLAKLARS